MSVLDELFSDFSVFDEIHKHGSVPDLLSVSFQAVASTVNWQGQDEILLNLLMVYSDYLTHVEEIAVQRALKLGAPDHYQALLDYAGRPDLLA